jgi:hypothetical protein
MYGVSKTKTFDSGKESVIIRNYVNGIMGGVILDMTGFSGEFIQCGHIIIRDTKSGEYKPMPVTGEAYDLLPESHEYVGICMTTAPVDTPHVGVMTAGEANDKAVPYPVDDTIKAALKIAVPTLQWGHDAIG